MLDAPPDAPGAARVGIRFPVRIFVSSTFLDLQPERLAVERMLNRLRETKLIGMEYFGARSESVQAASLAEVDECDIYIGIVAGRFGSGLTRAEYLRASERNIPRFIYLKEPSSISAGERDVDPEATSKLTAWIEELGCHTVCRFRNPDELAGLVAADLHRWLADNYFDEATRRRSLTVTGSGASEEYGARVNAFLTAYLGTEDDPVPFAGRAPEIEELGRWIDDPGAPRCLLLCSAAGRGKSALLCRWVSALVARADLDVIFAPVSIRYRTNTAEVVFRLIASKLALLEDPRRTGLEAATPETLRDIVATQLARAASPGRTRLIVVDGVDEAADFQLGADLLPHDLPGDLRIVVSARYTGALGDPRQWLQSLGWDRSGRATTIELALLSQDALHAMVGDVLGPQTARGDRHRIAVGLYRLSEGDPLVAQLWLQDVLKHRQRALDDLGDWAHHKSGLDSYLERWWEDQRRLWGSDSPLREPAVRRVLSVLACALGPLSRDDLIALAGPGLDAFALDEVMVALRRLVVGDARQQGFVLAHPRITDYLWQSLTASERSEWNQRFLAWGDDVLAALETDRIRPEQTPRYLLHYYAAHVERADASPDRLMLLLSAAWHRAWRSVEGSGVGYYHGVRHAWSRARSANQRSAELGVTPAHLGSEIRCALIACSITNSARDLTPELIARVVDIGHWTAYEGLNHAHHLESRAERVHARALLAPRLSPAHVRDALDEIARLEPDVHVRLEPEQRARAMAALAPHVPSERMPGFLDLILDDGERASATIVREVFRALAPEHREQLFRRLSMQPSSSRRVVLDSISRDLTEDQARRAMSWAHTDASLFDMAMLFLDLAARLPETDRLPIVARVLDVVERMPNNRDRWRAVLRMLPLSADADLERLLALAEDYVQNDPWYDYKAKFDNWIRAFEVDGRRVHLFAALPDAVRGRLGTEKWFKDQHSLRYFDDIELSRHWPLRERERYRKEVLDTIRHRKDDGYKLEWLAALIGDLPSESQADALGDMLRLLDRKPRSRDRRRLSHLARDIHSSLVPRLLEWSLGVQDRRVLVDAATRTVAALAEPVPGEIYDLVWKLSDRHQRADSLARLAPFLSAEQQRDCLARATHGRAGLVRRLKNRLGLGTPPDTDLLFDVLWALAPHIDSRVAAGAVDAIWHVSADHRNQLAVDMAPRMDDRSLRKAIRIVRLTWGQQDSRVWATDCDKGFVLPALLCQRALRARRRPKRAERSLLGKYMGIGKLGLIVECLSPDLARELAEQELSSEGTIYAQQVESVPAIFRFIDTSKRIDLFEHCVRRTDDEWFGKSKLIKALLGYLPIDGVDRAAELAKEVRGYRASTLLAVLGHASEQRQAELAATAFEIAWREHEPEIAYAITRYLSETYVAQVALRKPGGPADAEVLEYLLPRLRGEQREWAARHAMEQAAEQAASGHPSFAIYRLSKLMPGLPDELRAEAVEQAMGYMKALDSDDVAYNAERLAPYCPDLVPLMRTDDDERSLGKLADTVAGFGTKQQYDFLGRALAALEHAGRSKLLAFVGAMSGIVRSLGGPRALRVTAAAIHEVGLRWP